MSPTETLNPRYVAVLALASAIILIVGSMLRPEKGTPGPVQAPSESELARLARLSERRSLETTVDFFSAVASQADESTAWLPDARQTGVAWTTDLIVTARLGGPFPEAVRVATSAGEIDAMAILSGPDLPVAGVRSPEGGLTPIRRAIVLPQAGGWVVTVWRTNPGTPAFTPGHLATTAASTCGDATIEELVLTPAPTGDMAGGGVFDIDGDLVAVMLPCQGRVAAIAAASVDELLGRAGTPDGRFLGRFGIRVGPLDDREVEHFNVPQGLIVREVWNGYPADVAGLNPGDLVQAVNGSADVTEDVLYGLTSADASTPLRLTVRRGSATVEVTMPPAEVAVPAPVGSGLTIEAPLRGFGIDAVSPDGPAARAGIRPGDRLLRVDHATPRDLAQVRRLLNREGKTAFVEIERSGRRWGVLLS